MRNVSLNFRFSRVDSGTASQISPPIAAVEEACESDFYPADLSIFVSSRAKFFSCVIPSGVCGVEEPRLPAACTHQFPNAKKHHASDSYLCSEIFVSFQSEAK